MSAVQLYQIPLANAAETTNAEEWSKLISTLKEADGLRSVSWALQHEDPNVAGIAANFESLDAQKKWASSPQYDTVTKQLNALASGAIYDDVIVTAEDAEATLGANIVEFVSWSFPTSKVDEALKKKWVAGFGKFGQSILASEWSDGGLVAGWSINTYTHKGEESRRCTGLLGWKSYDAHYECKKTPTFTDHIHHLRDPDAGVNNVEMVHYKYSSHK